MTGYYVSIPGTLCDACQTIHPPSFPCVQTYTISNWDVSYSHCALCDCQHSVGLCQWPLTQRLNAGPQMHTRDGVYRYCIRCGETTEGTAPHRCATGPIHSGGTPGMIPDYVPGRGLRISPDLTAGETR